MRSRGLKVVKQGSEAMPGKSSARESGRASGGGLARDKAVRRGPIKRGVLLTVTRSDKTSALA